MENLLSVEFVQAGFSIAVAAFLLIRLEDRMKSLTEAINLLRRCQVCKFNAELNNDIQGKTL